MSSIAIQILRAEGENWDSLDLSCEISSNESFLAEIPSIFSDTHSKFLLPIEHQASLILKHEGLELGSVSFHPSILPISGCLWLPLSSVKEENYISELPNFETLPRLLVSLNANEFEFNYKTDDLLTFKSKISEKSFNSSHYESIDLEKFRLELKKQEKIEESLTKELFLSQDLHRNEQNRCIKLEKEVEILEKENEEVAESIEKREGALISLLESKDNKISELECLLSKQSYRIRALEIESKYFEESDSQPCSKIAEQEILIEKLEEKVEKLQEKTGKLKGKLQENDLEKKVSNNEKETESTIESLSFQLIEKSTELVELREKHVEKLACLETEFSQQLAFCHQTNQNLKYTANTLENSLNEQEKENKHLTNQIFDLQQKILQKSSESSLVDSLIENSAFSSFLTKASDIYFYKQKLVEIYCKEGILSVKEGGDFISLEDFILSFQVSTTRDISPIGMNKSPSHERIRTNIAGDIENKSPLLRKSLSSNENKIPNRPLKELNRKPFK